MRKRPHRPVVHGDPALGQFGAKPAQGKIRLGPLQQPVPVLASQLARFVPPIFPGEGLPVARWRCNHSTAVLIATPKRRAAALHDSPSRSTAVTKRVRKSIE